MSHVECRRPRPAGGTSPGPPGPILRSRLRPRGATVVGSVCLMLCAGLVLGVTGGRQAGGTTTGGPLGVAITSYDGDTVTTTPSESALAGTDVTYEVTVSNTTASTQTKRGGPRRPAGELHLAQRIGDAEHGSHGARSRRPHLDGPDHHRRGVGHAQLHRDHRHPRCPRVGRDRRVGHQRPEHHAEHRLGLGRGDPGGRPLNQRQRRRRLHRARSVGHLHDQAHQQRAIRGPRCDRHRDLRPRIRRGLRRGIHRGDDFHRSGWRPIPVDRHRSRQWRQRDAHPRRERTVAPHCRRRVRELGHRLAVPR